MNQQPPTTNIGLIIGKIFLVIIFLGLIAFIIIYSILKPKHEEHKTTGGRSAPKRISIGLKVYDNYFNLIDYYNNFKGKKNLFVL